MGYDGCNNVECYKRYLTNEFYFECASVREMSRAFEVSKVDDIELFTHSLSYSFVCARDMQKLWFNGYVRAFATVSIAFVSICIQINATAMQSNFEMLVEYLAIFTVK